MASGILIVDKPEDWTSQDVVAKLRGALHERRAGHGGTLDPMATGVLPVFFGRATRAVEFFEHAEKTYEAVVRLGLVTDTQDITGRVLEQRDAASATEADVRAALTHFLGPQKQVPPMYSAIKIGGKKLYELARRGEEVERKPRPVTIYELEVVEQTAPDAFTLRIRCSKGTYVRTLCHDIGRALGCGGCMSALRRTMAAGFTLADAVTLERVQLEGESLLQPVDSLFRAHPAYHIRTERAEALCRNGNPLAPPDAPADGLYRVYGRDGTFLCLSRAQNGTLTSLKNFFGA